MSTRSRDIVPRHGLRLLRTVFGAVLASGIAVGAAAAQGSARHAAMVLDANTGAFLHADRADEPRYPASLTKMMTLYMAFEAIERGRASYATRIKVSQEAASAPPTKLDLDPGETIALIDAMKSLITKSANDMAIAIAEHLGGSEGRFAQMMTDKARLMGMSRTTFRNASGLPDTSQLTTARDMITLAVRLQDDFPKHYGLFSTRTFTYDGSTYRNHNNLLFRYQGTEGIKTGYTRASGFNLVTSVRRDGRHVIGAVFGGASASSRDYAMQIMISRALTRASAVKTRRPAPMLVAQARPALRPQDHMQPRPAAAPAPAIALVPPVPEPRVRPVMVPQRPRSAETVVASAALPQFRVPAPTPAVRPPMAANRGTPPSTLQQQAQTLNQPLAKPAMTLVAGPLQTPSALRGPPEQSLVSPSAFEVQIGAFGSAVEADRALALARANASDLLQSRLARAVPVQKDTRQIFRARFTGFDSRAAANTCLELRRRQIDCFVMKSE